MNNATSIMDVMNTRELAYIAWAFVLFLALLLTKPFRSFLRQARENLARGKFLALISSAVLYMVAAIAILVPQEFDRPRFTFQLVVWFCIGALPSLWKAIEDAEGIRFDRFWDWTKTTFSLTTVVTFIVSVLKSALWTDDLVRATLCTAYPES